MPNLDGEAKRASDLLAGKCVRLVRRHRPGELLVEFTDGTRLFVDASRGELELSVTGGEHPDLNSP